MNTDNYGNLILNDNYPKVGEHITIEYIQEVDYIDMRTGGIAGENTPDEFVKTEVSQKNTETYLISAYVIIPYSIGYRYSTSELKAVLPAEVLETDTGKQINRLFYAFDTSDEMEMINSEKYLDYLTHIDRNIMYESKNKLKKEFENFKYTFKIVGWLMCLVVGLIGVLNYINTLIISFFERRREFAVMQAVGMTERQLKKMLMYESYYYLVISLTLFLIIYTLTSYFINSFLEKIFWFFEGKFYINLLLLMIPVLVLVANVTHILLYSKIRKSSIIDRIRE